jgi:hypothetical protein
MCQIRTLPHRTINYSITSSARSRIDGGTASPSALALLRFTATSNLVGSLNGQLRRGWRRHSQQFPGSFVVRDMADNLRATKGGQTTHYRQAGLNGTGLARVLGLPFQI